MKHTAHFNSNCHWRTLSQALTHPSWCFPFILEQLHNPLALLYIFITYNHIWSHVVFKEHSDSLFRLNFLYITVIKVLYSTITYVWAQDTITWDSMCRSSNCCKKKSLIVNLCHIYLIWFLKIFTNLFCYFFLCSFLCIYLDYSNYNQ